jgi:hypothetical protein
MGIILFDFEGTLVCTLADDKTNYFVELEKKTH